MQHVDNGVLTTRAKSATGIAVFHPIIPSHKLPLLALSQALSKREQLSRVERWAQSGPENAQVSGELKGFWSEVKKRLAEAHKTLMVLALHKVRCCFTCMVPCFQSALHAHSMPWNLGCGFKHDLSDLLVWQQKSAHQVTTADARPQFNLFCSTTLCVGCSATFVTLLT